MTIRVRSITAEESEILDRWQRCDDIVRYRRARILRLSETSWRCPAIAAVLALHVKSVRWVIKAFSEGGVEAITAGALSQVNAEGTLVSAGVYRYTTLRRWWVYLPLVVRQE